MAQAQRRRLRFEQLDDALAEAQRLVEAEDRGQVQRLGNWSVGQTLGHLAKWASFAFDGYPPAVQAPLPVRMILRLIRRRILAKGMMSGVRIRGVPEGTLGTEQLGAEEGLQQYRRAMERLREEAPAIANPVFGRLSHEQWKQLNLRHAELHMSFLLPSETVETSEQ
jgi:hypothetical protein